MQSHETEEVGTPDRRPGIKKIDRTEAIAAAQARLGDPHQAPARRADRSEPVVKADARDISFQVNAVEVRLPG
jgi:hypothetical protein